MRLNWELNWELNEFVVQSEGSDLVQRLDEWLIPYLSSCEDAESGSRDPLLADYLQKEAEEKLERSCAILQV